MHHMTLEQMIFEIQKNESDISGLERQLADASDTVEYSNISETLAILRDENAHYEQIIDEAKLESLPDFSF